MSNVYTDDPWAESNDAPEDPWAGTAGGFSDEVVESNHHMAAEMDTVKTGTFETEMKESTPVATIPAEDPIVLTFKQSGGYDAPWVVLRARTTEDAKNLVKDVVENKLFDAVNWAASEFAGKAKPAAPARTQPAPAQQYQPQAAQQGQGGDGRTCSHGVMNYKTGVSAKGPWKAYFCPTPKGTPDQCRAVFV